jgi:hypothetical protein
MPIESWGAEIVGNLRNRLTLNALGWELTLGTVGNVRN